MTVTGILPAGFAVPPLGYLVALLVGVAVTVGVLRWRRPRVSSSVVAAFAPWMVAGATLYALYQVRAPLPARPLFGAPAVYVTTFVVAGLVWAAVADRPAIGWSSATAPGVLAAVGTTFALGLVAYALSLAVARDTLTLVAPLAGLVVSLGLATVVWYGIRDRLSVAVTGGPGALVVVGHTLDGVSTALGTALGYGEQTPLSRVIIEFGASLPVEFLGGAWLFVLVKLLLAVVVLVAFREYVREEPTEGALLLGLLAAVGLGPGAHNIVLFAIS